MQVDHKELILEIAKKHNITPEELVGTSRKIDIAEARQEFMHACHEQGMSIAEIARFLDRDQSTVAYGIKVHKNKDTNPFTADNGRSGSSSGDRCQKQTD